MSFRDSLVSNAQAGSGSRNFPVTISSLATLGLVALSSFFLHQPRAEALTAGQASGLNLRCAGGFNIVNINSQATEQNFTSDNSNFSTGSGSSFVRDCALAPPPATAVDGAILLGGNVDITVSSGTFGTIYKDPDVSQQQFNGTGTQVVLPTTSFTTQARLDAIAVANYIESLAPGGAGDALCDVSTNCFYNTTTTLDTTFTGTRDLNVFQVNNPGQNFELAINGTADQFFVFNINGDYKTNKTAQISGGVTPSNVIFNFTSPTAELGDGGSADPNGTGTFLFTKGGAPRGANIDIQGSIVVIDNDSEFRIVSNSGVLNTPFNPTNGGPTPPVPGPLPIIGLLSAFSFSRKLRSRLKAA